MKTSPLLALLVGLLTASRTATDDPGTRVLDPSEFAVAVAPEAQDVKQEPLIAAERNDEAAGGWHKSLDNPVLGGNLGTCFDVSLVREGPDLSYVVFVAPAKSHRAGRGH